MIWWANSRKIQLNWTTNRNVKSFECYWNFWKTKTVKCRIWLCDGKCRQLFQIQSKPSWILRSVGHLHPSFELLWFDGFTNFSIRLFLSQPEDVPKIWMFNCLWYFFIHTAYELQLVTKKRHLEKFVKPKSSMNKGWRCSKELRFYAGLIHSKILNVDEKMLKSINILCINLSSVLYLVKYFR